MEEILTPARELRRPLALPITGRLLPASNLLADAFHHTREVCFLFQRHLATTHSEVEQGIDLLEADGELLQVGRTVLDAGVGQHDIVDELERLIFKPFCQGTPILPLEVDGHFHQLIDKEKRVPVDLRFLCEQYQV